MSATNRAMTPSELRGAKPATIAERTDLIGIKIRVTDGAAG
jgi:hypothetical protein